MFRYWTEEEFPSCFRRMLTLEQYRSAEMSALYQQYLAAGPLEICVRFSCRSAAIRARRDCELWVLCAHASAVQHV